jgi:hypothetical protein
MYKCTFFNFLTVHNTFYIQRTKTKFNLKAFDDKVVLTEHTHIALALYLITIT